MNQLKDNWKVEPIFDDESELPTGDYLLNHGAPVSEYEAYVNAKLMENAPEMLTILQESIVDGRLQTFEDRERFRKKVRTLLTKLER